MKKPGTAWAVLAIVLVLGTLFGTHRSLAGLQKTVENAFYVGVDNSNYGIQTNLDLRIEYARNLCKISAKYDAADETAAVQSACDTLENASDFSEKYRDNTALTDAVDTLDQTMKGLSLSTEDEGYRASLTADLDSYEMRIDKLATPFNSEVRAFNDTTLGSFPASVLGHLTGVDEVEEYA